MRLVLIALAVAVLSIPTGAGPAPLQAPHATAAASDAFFSVTKLHTAHLTFTPDAWAAMQPRGGGMFSGGFGGGGGFLGAEGSRNGVAARMGVVFDYAHARLDLDGTVYRDVAVRYKGNGSYMQGSRDGKISLKVDLNKFVPGQQVAGARTLNFQNNITDISWMNEVLSYRLYRDAGSLAPRSSYVKVYLTVTGQFARRYWGLYSISENPDLHFIEERFGVKTGAIVKPSTRAPFTYLGDNWAAYNQTYDPKTDLTDAEKSRIIEFCRFVSYASDADFRARIGDYLDLDQFARYFAVLSWIANSDSLLGIGQNYYVYMHPKTRKLIFSAWDQDFSFGRGTPSWTIHYPWQGSNVFLGRVYAVDAFRNAYLARMAEFSKTIFRPERFEQQIREIAPVLRPAIEEEGRQWLTPFEAIAAGTNGILPYVRSRAAFVERELASPR